MLNKSDSFNEIITRISKVVGKNRKETYLQLFVDDSSLDERTRVKTSKKIRTLYDYDRMIKFYRAEDVIKCLNK